MKLSVSAMAITSGVVWGGCMLTCGLVNLAAPSYGRKFLKLMSSVYPGFHNSRDVTDVLVGAGYGFVDGLTAGLVFAGIYNRFVKGGDDLERGTRPARSTPAKSASEQPVAAI